MYLAEKVIYIEDESGDDVHGWWRNAHAYEETYLESVRKHRVNNVVFRVSYTSSGCESDDCDDGVLKPLVQNEKILW